MKVQIGSTVLEPAYTGSLEKRPLSGCLSACCIFNISLGTGVEGINNPSLSCLVKDEATKLDHRVKKDAKYFTT